MQEPLFLTLAEVVEIHRNQVELYGGHHGVRDMGLLQSAIAQPQASFGGAWLHEDLYLMASAYAFHLCQNHPFFDGNKRTALASALTFLELNGISLEDPKQKLYEVMMTLSQGNLKKNELAEIFKELAFKK